MGPRASRFHLPVLAQDVLLAILVTLAQVQGTTSASENSEAVSRPLTDLGSLGYILLIVSGLALTVRRRWPVPVFLVTALASLVYYTAGYSDGPAWLALFIALYTLTAYGDGRRSLAIAGVGITVLSTAWIIAAADIETTGHIGWLLFRMVASIMAAALGESVRSRHVIATEALERAELAERTKDGEARSRVAAERLRIAREVHDTVAHAMAIINVQAGVTAYQIEKRPEQVGDALKTIEETSAQALHEMRAILGVLRDADNGRVPHPGLGQINDLIEMARDAGLAVELDVGSPTVSLPSAVDGTAYRVVQESITNVIRHVGPTRVSVTVDYGSDTLELRTADEGARDRLTAATPAATSPSDGEGNGILGMRERCELLGGELTAGPLPSGGFEVLARLPLAPHESVLA